MKIKGAGKYTDVSGENHNIIGFGDLPDSEKFLELEVSGNLSFKNLSCKEVRISGKCEGDSITAYNLKISGVLSVEDVSCEEAELSGKCKCNSFTAKNFSTSGKVEVDSLTVEETLKLSGRPQINLVEADKISIASCDGSLGKIKCHSIKIYDADLSAVQRSRVQINSIEADIVDLENCKVEVIRCKDAFIGSNCAIEKLFVAGKFEIADDSTIGETIRT